MNNLHHCFRKYLVLNALVMITLTNIYISTKINSHNVFQKTFINIYLITDKVYGYKAMFNALEPY